MVNIKTCNLISAEGDTKMQPGVGTHPIKTEEKETKHLKAHSTTIPHRGGHNGGRGTTSAQTG